MLRRLSLLVALGSLAGCSLVLEADAEAGTDTGTDAGTGASLDCDVQGDVGHWRLEGRDDLTDELGGPSALGFGQLENATGPVGCGLAVRLDADELTYLAIEHHVRWSQVRAIDLHVRLPLTGSGEGVIGSDSSGNQTGHLSVWAAESSTGDGLFVARFQDGLADLFRCARRPRDGRWVHLGINVGVGGFELWVDGSPADFAGTARIQSISSGEVSCTPAGELGPEANLEANPNPWVLGASSGNSEQGELDSIERHLQGAALDNLRFWSERQDFQR